MTRVLAIVLLAFLTLHPGPAAATEPAAAEEPRVFLGMTQKQLAVAAALTIGTGLAVFATAATEYLAINIADHVLGTFAVFEIAVIPLEAGLLAYFWPEEDVAEPLDASWMDTARAEPGL